MVQGTAEVSLWRLSWCQTPGVPIGGSAVMLDWGQLQRPPFGS